MDETLENDLFDGKLRVEINVATGGVSNVSFTTMVVIDPSDKEAARSKLRDTAELLRGALPFNALKAEEQEFNANNHAVGVGPDGPIDKETALKASQEALKAIQPKG